MAPVSADTGAGFICGRVFLIFYGNWRWIFVHADENVFPDITVVYLMISGVLSILLFGWIYHRDVQERKNRAIWEEHTHLGAGTILLIMLGGAGVALAGNQLVNLTPLMELSENYVETSEALSAGNAWLDCSV